MTALYFLFYTLTAAVLFALCFTVGFMSYRPAPVTADGFHVRPARGWEVA